MSRAFELGITAAAVPVWLALLAAQRDLDDDGRKVPCESDPEPFVSEDRAERAEAAEACGWCPVLPLCASFAELNSERHHVWGGADRTPRPRGSPIL